MSKKICDHCKKSPTISGKHKYCQSCENEIKVPCKKEGCNYKRSTEHPYCDKHKICFFVDQTNEIGKKVCNQYIRGCRMQLDMTYAKTKCEDCLEKERIKDKELRDRKKEQLPKKNADGNKLCERCFGYFDESEFIGNLQKKVIGCKKCRETDKINGDKKDKEHCNELFRKRFENEEYREKYYARKKNWRESNYSKVIEYWRKSRAKKFLEKTEEERAEIRKQNAAWMKQWRKDNREKVLQTYINKKESISLQYNVYTRTANIKNLEFDFTIEEFNELVKEECYYCGIIQEKGFNGVDRINPNLGYTKYNCKSCCIDCNMLKQSLPENIFLKRIQHILTYQEIIENGNLHNDLFCNHKGTPFSEYKKSAEKRNKNFELKIEEFNDIRKEECYLCGKENDVNHKNGIDRVNNKEGYTIENCEACCGECNYLKKDFDIDYLLLKLEEIYNNRKTETGFIFMEEENENNLKSIYRHLTKQTKEERQVIKQEKKDNKLKILEEKYPQFVKNK